MKRTYKSLLIAAAAVGIVGMQGCTPQQQAFAAGAAVGGVAGAAFASYDYPYYFDRPYYFYHGYYYYGGHYHRGCYIWRGRRLCGGHYYHDGWRYYNGRRYRAQVGRYGYYPSRRVYERYTRRIRNPQGGSGSYRPGGSGVYKPNGGSGVYRPHTLHYYGSAGSRSARFSTTSRPSYRPSAAMRSTRSTLRR